MKQAAPYSNTLIRPKSQGISPGHTVQLDWWWWGGTQQWLQEEQTGAVCENKLLYSRTAQGAVFNDIPSRLLPPHMGGLPKTISSLITVSSIGYWKEGKIMPG